MTWVEPAMWIAFTFVAIGVVALLGAMGGRREERRRWEERFLTTLRSNDTIGDATSRMEQLSRAVDAIAIEVERLGEGQRYVTKLLAERRDSERALRSPQPGSVQASPRPSA